MQSNDEYQKLINSIEREIPYVDKKPYSHNIININLSIIGDKFGQDKVKQIISQTNLKYLGWGYILQNMKK